MIGELVSSCLILVLGYAYPAFQCFKAVEKNGIEIPELRFWCQYWIIVAVITILERIGDAFISWVPMYGEIKLALFIYLWYPQTKGTRYIYNRLLRPYMSRHETDIDRSLIEFRQRAWNFAVCYWQNCTELGSSKILQFLEFVSSQARRNTRPKPENVPNQQQYSRTQRSAPPVNQRWHAATQPSAPPVNQGQYAATQPSAPPVELENQTQFIEPEDVLAARHRLRRFIDGE